MAEARPLARVEDVRFQYDEAVPALRGVSLTLEPGEFVALVGPNGSGKTTLAKQLNGLLYPSAGRVLVAGQDTRERSTGDLARTVGYVFQNPDHQIFQPTVAQEVAFGPRNLGVAGAELSARVEESLARFGLAGLAERHPMLLGRGARRRVALAAVYAMHPRLLVLDEPTGGLDRRDTADLMAALEEIVAGGRTVLLITHDMRLVAAHARRLVAMRDGLIVADGPVRELLADPALAEAAGIVPPAVARLAADLAPLGIPPALSVDDLVSAVLARLAARRAPAGRGRGEGSGP